MASRPLVGVTTSVIFDIHVAAAAKGNVCAKPSEPAPKPPNTPVGPAGIPCDASLNEESDDHVDMLDI